MGGNVIENRTRPFAYTFRTNEKEKNLIDKAISASGLTMREFVIRAIINKPVIVIERGGEILAELKRKQSESGCEEQLLRVKYRARNKKLYRRPEGIIP